MLKNWEKAIGYQNEVVSLAKDRAIFYGANGFPIKTYQDFLEEMASEFNLVGLENRAIWSNRRTPFNSRNWNNYADDLLSFIEHNCHEKVVGIGHSLGAVSTLLAAERKPELFKYLVLIEPVLMPAYISVLSRLLPKTLMKYFEPVKGAIKRRSHWKSKEDYLNYLMSLNTYKRFNQRALELMLEGAIEECDKGQYQLKFSHLWEAHNFSQPPYIMKKLINVKVPTLIVGGKPSMFMPEKQWRRLDSKGENLTMMRDNHYGHLFPLESPVNCKSLITGSIDKVRTQIV